MAQCRGLTLQTKLEFFLFPPNLGTYGIGHLVQHFHTASFQLYSRCESQDEIFLFCCYSTFHFSPTKKEKHLEKPPFSEIAGLSLARLTDNTQVAQGTMLRSVHWFWCRTQKKVQSIRKQRGRAEDRQQQSEKLGTSVFDRDDKEIKKPF